MYRFIILLASTCLVGALARGASAEDVIFASFANGRLEKFDTAGNSLGGRTISSPISIALDSDGNSYVASFTSLNVYRYDATGRFQNVISATQLDGEMPALIGGSAVGPGDNFYLGVVTNTRRIERFDSAGNSTAMLQLGGPSAGSPLALAFDNSGNLYVDMGYRIVSFDANGARSTFVNLPQFARDIAIDNSGNLFAIMGDIVEYSSSGQLLRSFAPGFDAAAIAVDSTGMLYVGGSLTSAGEVAIIQKFSPDGTPLGRFSQLPYWPNSAGNIVNDLVITNGSMTQFGVPEPAGAILALIALCAPVITLRRFRNV